MTTKTEPKRRADGLCVVCKKKPALLDAFCSTVCCKTYFESEYVTTSTSKPT